MKKYLTVKVFTPTIPAELTFVERDEINDRLVDALNQPGKQIVVYGHTGSGKTTLLLNKLKQTYENHITSRCSESMTVDQLMLDAFDKLNEYYSSEVTTKKTKKIGTDFGSEYLQIKALLKAEFSSETGNKLQRIVQPQLTTQRLAEFLGEARYCWVIEDFHKVKDGEKTELSQRIKIFMDTASEYPEVKIIAIGAVGTAREVIAYDKEMQNRVAEIHVPLLNKNQLLEIIRKGENLLNIRFGAALQNKIIDLANGLGAVCHQICLNMCNLNGILETLETTYYLNENHLDEAIKKYINEQSDSFKATFENAIKIKKRGDKYPNGRLILMALSHLEEEQATHSKILNEIRKKDFGYPSGTLTANLKILTSKEKDEILRYDEKSGKYSFSNPFLKVYSRLMLDKKDAATAIFNFHTDDSTFIFGNSNVVVGNLTSGIEVAINTGNVQTSIKNIYDSPNDLDWDGLDVELNLLLEFLEKRAINREHSEAIVYLVESKKGIRKDDKVGSLKMLSRVGSWAFEIAKELGLSEVIKAIELSTNYSKAQTSITNTHDSSNDINWDGLDVELNLLLEFLKKRAIDREHFEGIVYVFETQKRIRKDDKKEALKMLSEAGSWAFEIAKELGLSEVIKVVELSTNRKL